MYRVRHCPSAEDKQESKIPYVVICGDKEKMLIDKSDGKNKMVCCEG